MEISSGEEFYIACDNTGTPLAVFSNNGLLLKQVQYTAYGEVYFDSNPDFVLVIGFHGGLYDPLTRLLHFGDRDYDIPAGRYVELVKGKKARLDSEQTYHHRQGSKSLAIW